MPPSPEFGSLSEGEKTLEVGVERMDFGLGFLGIATLYWLMPIISCLIGGCKRLMWVRYVRFHTP